MNDISAPNDERVDWELLLLNEMKILQGSICLENGKSKNKKDIGRSFLSISYLSMCEIILLNVMEMLQGDVCLENGKI